MTNGENLSENWVSTVGFLCKFCNNIKTHLNIRIGCSMHFIEVQDLSS